MKTQSDKNRRNTLKAILAGGAGATVMQPASWQSPVIKSLVIPAHAAMSGFVPAAGGAEAEMASFDNVDFQGKQFVKSDTSDELLLGALGVLSSSANAGMPDPCISITASVCVTPFNEGTRADVDVLFTTFYGKECPSDELWKATNVPLNSETDLSRDSGGCDNIQSNSISDLLITPAFAGGDTASINIESLMNGAKGTVYLDSKCKYAFGFDVPPGSCDLSAIECCDD